MGILGKIDDTVKLKKCIKAKDRGRKKKIDGRTKMCKCDILGPQKSPPHIKKGKVGLGKTKEKVSKRKGKERIKVFPNRNPFNVGDLVMSTAKQISHPAY